MQADAENYVVLVIEDEPMISALLTELLEMEGFQVLQAATPAEAEYLWAREMGHIDILFSDYTLPGRCGFEMAREFQLLKPDLRVVLMSGHDDLPSSAMDVPGAVFLKKPFGVRGLQSALRHVVPAGRLSSLAQLT